MGTSPEAMQNPKPWHRLYARMIDYGIYTMSLTVGVYLLALYFPFNDILLAFVGFVMLGVWRFGFWLPFEAFCISKYGTTVGKWLLNIQVLNQERQHLTYLQALKRGAAAYINGQFLLVPVLTLISHFLSYTQLKKEHTTSWDKKGGYIVLHREIGLFRTIIALLLVALSLLNIWIFKDVYFKELRFILMMAEKFYT